MKRGRLLALLLAVIMACSFTGCKDKFENRDDTLYIVAINKGYGTQWLKDIGELFSQKYPGYTVDVTEVYDDGVITQRLESGAEYCNYDLMISGAGRGLNDGSLLADLTDVYEDTLPGRSDTIMGQTDPTLLDSFRVENADGTESLKYMAWTDGVNGLLINYSAANALLGADWESRYSLRTTDELLEFAAAIKSAATAASSDVTAFGHCADTHYYHFLYETWWAQYEGLTGVNNFYNGIYYDEAEESYQEGPGVFEQQGLLESMKVMYEIFSPDAEGGGYSHSRYSGMQWDAMQTQFMLGSFVMLSNGDWNNLEMSRQFPDADVRFVRLPVISALGEKLGISEQELRDAVDYADGKTQTAPDIGEDELAAVVEARTLTHTYADAYVMASPSYSKKIDAAKDYIKLMLSDEGQNLYVDATGGLTAGSGYNLENHPDYENLSDFAKSRWNILKGRSFFLFPQAKYAKAGIQPFGVRSLGPVEALMARDYNRYTAKMAVDYDITFYNTGANWSNLAALANS